MALPLLEWARPGYRWAATAVMTVVLTIVATLLLMPTSTVLAFSVVAALWIVYALIRVVLFVRERRLMGRGKGRTGTGANYLERDEATGLAGRVDLTTALEREIARSRRQGCGSALYVLDTRIVNFRPANPGDRAPSPAQYVATVLVEQGRSSDLVCRVDLTRFAVVLADASSEGAGLYEERIRTALSAKPYATNEDGSGIWVRGWGGWAAWDESMTRPAHWLMAALASMEEQRQIYESEQVAFGGRALVS